jgi:hypothetical protein
MFKPGDKVICVDPYGTYELKIGTKLIVEEVEKRPTSASDNVLVHFKGYKNSYQAHRFVLDEEKPNTVDEPPVAAKNDQDKIDLSLIPAVSLKEHAKAFMVGEKKYGRYNYCKGHKASQLVAAAMRHLTAWNEGEENDVDGQHHLGSVMACCSMILRQAELGTLKDDRYKK